MSVYLGKNKVSLVGGTTTLNSSGGTDTSDATATTSDLLFGKTAYVKGIKLTGTMVDKTGQNVTISQKYEVNKIPKGYYNGESTVDIDTQSFNNIIPDNIKKGVTILGITGTYEGSTSSSSGMQVKTGTSSSSTINTGLNNISYFILYANKINSVGVINLVYDTARQSSCTLTFCGEYSVYYKYCSTITKQPFSISGGIITWTETIAEYCFMNNTTYNWIAVGN